MREDLELRDYAESKGFTVIEKSLGEPLTYKKDRTTVWRSGIGSKSWAWARLIDGRYISHTYFDNLKDALDFVFDPVERAYDILKDLDSWDSMPLDEQGRFCVRAGNLIANDPKFEKTLKIFVS